MYSPTFAIWEPSDDLAASYVEFWGLNEEIRRVLTDYADQEIHLWTIEHAFWYWQQRDEFENEPETVSDSRQTTLPDSYIPSIVSILPKLARNTDEIRELAGETGQSVETLFENRLAKCLRMLGFEVDELGQGAGGILMELRKIDCTIMQLSTMRKFEAMAIASGLVTNGSSKTTSIGKSLRFVLTDSGTSISP